MRYNEMKPFYRKLIVIIFFISCSYELCNGTGDEGDIVLYKKIYYGDNDIKRLMSFIYVGENRRELEVIVSFTTPHNYNVNTTENIWNKPHVPLYLYSGYSHVFKSIIKDSSVNFDRRLTLITKGKHFISQVALTHFKEEISNIWHSVSSSIGSMLFLDRYSNIWSRFSFVTIDEKTITLSNSDSSIIDIKDGSSSKYTITNVKCIEKIKCKTDHIKILTIDSVDISHTTTTTTSDENKDYRMKINDVKTAKSHNYTLVLDLDQDKNFLPTHLYFLLYSEDKWRTSSKKLNSNTVIRISIPYEGIEEDENIIEISGIDTNYELNTQTNEIILGSELFTKYQKIHYNRIKDEFMLLKLKSLPSETVKIILSFLIIIMAFLLVRWLTDPHFKFFDYFILRRGINTTTGRRKIDKYIKEKEILFEIFAIFIAIAIGIISLFSMHEESITRIRNVLLSILLYHIIISIYVMIKRRKLLTSALYYLLNNGKGNGYTSSPSRRKTKYNNENLREKETIGFYLCRHLTHVIIILISISLGLNFSSNLKLYSLLLVLTSLMILYYSIYNIITMTILILFYNDKYKRERRKRRNINIKNMRLWILFLIIEIIIVFILAIFVTIDVIIVFFDSSNSVYPKVLIDLAAIMTIIIVITLPSYTISYKVEQYIEYEYMSYTKKKKKR
jgi:hypothetical protein